MDAGMAERLAASMDPKALGTLQNHNSDPAVARAVAAQFGSFLMQGMMQDADGGAMSIAGGTGGAAISSMFASAMGRYAMSGDKLGLADTIYRSMAAKGAPEAAPQGVTPDSGASPTAATNNTAASPQGAGISLGPYWQDRGHRPLGSPVTRMAQPAGFRAPGKTPTSPVATTNRASLEPAAKHVAPASQNVRGPAAPVATTAAPSNVAQPPHRIAHAQWMGLSLPAQAHVLLPPAEPDPPEPVATATPAAAPTSMTIAAPVTTGGAGVEPVPYGLPWTHGKGGAETGTVNRHDAAATGGGSGALADAENFAEELAPAIQQAAARLGVSPRILLAQAALETGWGHSVVGNNIFGIKAGASWPGAIVTASTHEMEGGRLVAHQGTFRSYANVGQAVNDYVSLVSASDRYRTAIGAGDNVAAYAQALAAGGYASDRNYAAKLMAVANSSKMSYAVASLEDEPPGRLVSAHG
jgi:hypothetical protein